MRNKRGPRIEPWGTPNSISAKDDFTPFNLTNCDLELK